MTAVEGVGKRELARIRSIYCSPENRALIGRRAKEAGMSFSRFMIVCALHGSDGDDGEEGCCFARNLTADFPDCLARPVPGFPTLFGLFRSDGRALTVSDGGATALPNRG